MFHIGFFESSYYRIKTHITIKGVIADSGFYIRKLIDLLEQYKLTYIIAARLYKPLQRKVYAQQTWEQIAEGLWITEFRFRHDDRKTEERYI